MKKSKKIPKTHLPKFAPGGTMNFDEFGQPIQDQKASGTQNIYNQNRGSKINAGQYAGLASTIGMGASQMAMNNNSLTGEEKQYANNQAMQNTADGVISQMPGFGQYYGLMKGASDLGKSMLTKDDYGNYKTGVDKAGNEIMTADHAHMINDISNKNYTALGLDSMGLGKFARMGSQLTGNSQKTDGGWGKFNKFIGITPDKTQFAFGGINAQPNAEIESEENVVAPNGGFLQANGPTHEQGGVPVALPGNSMIFSDRLKAPGSKKTFAQLNKINNTNKEDKILDSNKTSSMSKRTAELMKFVKNKNSETLFNEQEALKQAKVEAYAKKMGVNLNQSPEALQEFPNGGEIPYDKSLISLKDKTDSLNYAEGYYKGIKYGSLDEHGNTAFGGRNTSGLSYRNDLMNFSKNFAIRQNVPSSAGEYQGYKDADEKYKSKVNLSNDDVYKLAKSEDGVSDNFFDDSKPLYLKNLSKYDQERVAKLKIYLNNQNSQKHSNGGIQKYPIGGVKLPMYPYGGDLDANMLSYGGDDPRFYNYQGSKVVKPNLNALNKDKGVSSDIGLNNYNNLLTTRAQVRDSKVLPTTTLPKFEYVNDPSKGSYDEQFNAYKKVYLPGFKFGGKKLPKYEFGVLTPEEKFRKKQVMTAEQNQKNLAFNKMTGNTNPGYNTPQGSAFTPEMIQASSDAMVEDSYPESASTTPINQPKTYPIRKDKNGKLLFDTPTSTANNAGSKRDQELYDAELARMNASGGRDSNKFDWKNTLGQVGNFAAQNAGNIYNLSRYNKPEIENYERLKATYLDPTAAIRDANDQARRAEYNVRGASAGNAGTYLSNRVALATQNTINKDRIRKEYANTNAGIANSVGQYNNELARQEVIANAMNRARNRSGKGEAISQIGKNYNQQVLDTKKGKMEESMMQMLPKLVNDPSFMKFYEEYKKNNPND